MKGQTKDQPVLDHIQSLITEEHRLYSHGSLKESDRKQLTKIEIELDQCWDLLRQRRALRDAGQNPNDAQIRPPEIVEKYEQ